MREHSPLNNITGVTAGGTCSITMPVGYTYDKVHFKYSGVTAAQIKNLRLELNGRLLTEYSSLDDLIKENDYYGRQKVAGLTTLHFVRPEVKSALKPTLVEQRFFALGTTGLNLVQIKFDIDQAAAAPDIKAYAEKSAAAKPGWLFKRRTFRYNFVEGVTEIENLPRPKGSYIAMIEIKKAGVTTAEFMVNNHKWRDKMPADLHSLILKQGGRTPQADIHAVDLMNDGDVFGALMLDTAIYDMRLSVDCSSAGQGEVVVHYFDNFEVSSF